MTSSRFASWASPDALFQMLNSGKPELGPEGLHGSRVHSYKFVLRLIYSLVAGGANMTFVSVIRRYRMLLIGFGLSFVVFGTVVSDLFVGVPRHNGAPPPASLRSLTL